MKTYDLSGTWRYATDETEKGILEKWYETTLSSEGFTLPGSSCSNQIGTKKEYYDSYSKAAVRAPIERYEYIGPLWLQHEIEILPEHTGKDLFLFFERINVASTLWLDGKQIGREIIELSTPHVYKLPKDITAGRHQITLRLLNSNILSLGDMSSGYSVDTQGYWNGIIGRMELQVKEPVRIENAQIEPWYSSEDWDIGADYPNVIRINATICSEQIHPLITKQAKVSMSVTDPYGKRLPVQTEEITLFTSKQTNEFFYNIPNGELWSEFNPALYTLSMTIEIEDESTTLSDTSCFSFGLREIHVEDKQFVLNSKPVYLRGTINCAQFPLTGFPPMDEEYWAEQMAIYKSYGLNHVRFHAWCPPEAAFTAADKAGMYLQIEMPLWLNVDICPYSVMDDPVHRSYFMMEMRNILTTYGNHPSFLLFSNGNENIGDFEFLEELTTMAKALDTRHLYTMTSNFDHPMSPEEDFFEAFCVNGKAIRIQDLHDEVAKDTALTFTDAADGVDTPVISFEVGQYCVYPDVDIIEQYTGNMLPVNFDVIRKEMKLKGVYDRKNDYIAASGDLAVKLYKEDIEAMLRTENMSGFQLLSLCDYTGQSTATIGILDVFGDSKGVTTPSEWTEFCGPVVPLFMAKRIYKNNEIISAKLALYNHGEKLIKEPTYKVMAEIRSNNGETQKYFESEFSTKGIKYADKAEENMSVAKVDIPLTNICEPAELLITVSVNDYKNSWRIFVFPTENNHISSEDFVYAKSFEEIDKGIENGKKVIADIRMLDKTIKGDFIPVFWSPVHFPSSKPCGAIIKNTEKIFNSFPTQQYIDYQWKDLLESSVSADLSALPDTLTNISVMMELVPNYVDNTKNALVFEAEYKSHRILFSGFDFTKEDEVTLTLLKSFISGM